MNKIFTNHENIFDVKINKIYNYNMGNIDPNFFLNHCYEYTNCSQITKSKIFELLAFTNNDAKNTPMIALCISNISDKYCFLKG